MNRRVSVLLTGLLLVAPWAGLTSTISGCGSEFEQLFDDLEDADDLEEVGEAFDDFFDEVEDEDKPIPTDT